MARLEIPSIVVHKGGRSESRPESPVTVCESEMPSLPASSVLQASSDVDAPSIEAEIVEEINNTATVTEIRRSSSAGHSDTEIKNFRNRANSKVKLLVRSHAMRESTSPPRGDGIQNGSTSPGQSSLSDAELTLSPSSGGKKYVTNGNNSLSPTPNNNNNEELPPNNGNVINGGRRSPKQMRNTATSPTCRTSSRNSSSSPSPSAQHPKNSPNDSAGKYDENNKRGRSINSGSNYKCNNCTKGERPVLLQTPISPSKNQQLQHKSPPNSQHKSDQKRPNHNLNVCNSQCSAQCGNNTLSVNRSNSRHKLRHQNSSSQSGSYESTSPCLSRDNSGELYTDSTGIDLEQFIAETINRNQKDRTVLLRIEKDLIEFAKDKQKASHKFPNMSSYNRMLVHRVAAYFGMEHNVDQSGLSVIITRTKNMRIPDTRFKEHIRDDLLLAEEPRRSILKRDSSSFEDGFNFKSPDRLSGEYCRRSKSFEEREEEYEKARRRIFENSSADGGDVSPWPYWSSSESSDASVRYRLLPPTEHCMRQGRLSKGESLDGRESYRSNGSRPSVSKSHSFGGYSKGLLVRGDSVTSTHSAGPRLMKQDSGASMCSRLSPSSSGYKSQSQRSDTTISPSPSPSPNMICNHAQITSQDMVSPELNSQTIMWAVTSISSVPPGSVIINPQNNQPYTNPDGTIYRFDPDNPPKLVVEDIDARDSSHHPEYQHGDSSESQVTVIQGKSHEYPSKRRPQHSGKCNSNSVASLSPSVASSSPPTTSPVHHVTNTATSPSRPYTPPPAPPPPPAMPIPTNPGAVVQQSPHQQLTTTTSNNGSTVNRPVVAQQHQAAAPQQPPQQYATYVPATDTQYGQGVYPQPLASTYPPNALQQQQQQPQTVMMAPQPQGQSLIATGQEDSSAFAQNSSIYGNYPVSVQQQSNPQSAEVAELSGYFMGMNVYDQRGTAADSQATNVPYSQAQSASNQSIQPMQTSYWQTPPNQIPPQQTMYFIQSPETTLPVNQTTGDTRQQCNQQQRFATSYGMNLQTMTPPTQTNAANYMNSYPVSYNTMTTVTPSPGEYACQPPMHMIPTYYPPGQPGIQPPPLMYRVPTPPNTPASSQIPSMPVMYMNSNNYPPPAMMTAGTYGHQVGPNGRTAAPPGGFVTPTMVPNLIFRQNVPLVAGVRASTPGSSQKASRSPTPAHEFFGNGSGDRNAQAPTRYPLPMYQGVHIVQGDVRLMHPGMPGNPRLQYAPVGSPPVIGGCPRSYRAPNVSNATVSYDGKNQKFRKQSYNASRSKTGTITTTPRSNTHSSPSTTSVNAAAQKEAKEGTVKVTITRRNHLL